MSAIECGMPQEQHPLCGAAISTKLRFLLSCGNWLCENYNFYSPMYALTAACLCGSCWCCTRKSLTRCWSYFFVRIRFRQMRVRIFHEVTTAPGLHGMLK